MNGIKRVKLFKLRSAFLLGISTVILSVSSFGGYVSAATAVKSAATPTAVSNNANTLKISPVRSSLTVAAGTSTKVSTFITNPTAAAVVLQPIENDFVAGDEKGTPSIILDENSYAPTHSLKRFMVPLQAVTVPANSTKQVDVTITVPASAQAGGYYGAIRFAPYSPDGSKSVNLSASVASLILMTVPGDLIEQLNLTNFDIQQNGGTGSNFRTPDNLNLLLRFENKGNVQVAPFGQVSVIKGKKVVYAYSFNQNDPRDQVLSDSARRWTIPLKGLGKFGKYTVTGTFTYGTSSKSVEITKTIWIVPTTYIYGGLVAIAILIALIVAIVVFLKGYKKRILKKSRRRY